MKKKYRKNNIRRKQGARGRSVKKLLLSLFFSLLAGSAAAGAYFLAVLASPLFSMPAIAIRDVSIKGGENIELESLFAKAGINRRTNIMELDLPRARKTMLEEDPYIKDVIITRNPASGKLSFTFEMRAPAAFVNVRGRLMAVDGTGLIIGDIERIDFRDLPVITGLDPADAAPGDRIESWGMSAALKIIEYSGESGLDSYFVISEINVSDRRNILVYAGEDGMQIRFRDDRLQEKVREAAAVAAYLEEEGQKAEYIDLRFRNTIVKPVSEGG